MNIQDKVWKIGAAVGVLLAVFLAILSIKELKSIGYVGVNTDQTSTITVDGTGEAVTVPDIATISFTMSATAKTVALAQSSATAKNNSALKSLRDAGIADKDIKTTSYSINPHYEYQNSVCNSSGYCPPSRSVITGYDISQSTEVRVHDLTKVGDLFTTLGSQGVDSLIGPSFAVDNPDAPQAAARAEAIAKARAKADVLAAKLGVRLARVVNFSEEGNNPGPIYYAMGVDSAAKTRAPEVSTGENKITTTVSITYQIE